MVLRVGGGIARGRRLVAPRGLTVRPTSDRVREAIFDLLGPAPPRGPALDLFAGTGALGIEAASRGARAAILVDRDPRAVSACRRNVESVPELSSAIRVVRADAFDFLRRGDPDLPADLVLLDPPYAFDRWDALGRALIGCGAIRAGSIVVRERAARSAAIPMPGCRPERTARYGDTSIDVMVVERAAEETGHGV